MQKAKKELKNMLTEADLEAVSEILKNLLFKQAVFLGSGNERLRFFKMKA
jgi:hypothetical protein